MGREYDRPRPHPAITPTPPVAARRRWGHAANPRQTTTRFGSDVDLLRPGTCLLRRYPADFLVRGLSRTRKTLNMMSPGSAGTNVCSRQECIAGLDWQR